jgi:hypothetical protein
VSRSRRSSQSEKDTVPGVFSIIRLRRQFLDL